MATYLELVNSVMKRLREDEVTSVSDNTLSSLVGEFVNTIKSEVEDAWNWNVLRNTIQLSTSASTFRYILTSTRYGARLLSVYNDTDDFWMKKWPADKLTQALNGSSPESASPIAYGPNGADSNGDIYLDLYPIPDGVYTVNVDVILPQADLSADNDVLLVPSNVVTLGAWALAISERGEDGGVGFAEMDAKYRLALGDAIAADTSNQHLSELMWTVV